MGEVEQVSALEQLKEVSSFALVAVDYDALTPEEQADMVSTFAARSDRPTLLLLSERNVREDLPLLFSSRILTNMLVVDASGPDASDLLVTVQKIRHGEIFGLEKYFMWGVEPRGLTINSSLQKAPTIQTIGDYVRGIGVTSRLRSLIRMVADEFLTNALYNAPVGPDGASRHGDTPRTEPVDLLPGEQVEVRYCCDGRRFGLSITDPFGSLAPNILQDYLARAFRAGPDQISESPGGAGLGFYQILGSLSHFVVNIDPGHRTEMIGLVDVSGSFRTFASGGKSFNIFVTEPSR